MSNSEIDNNGFPKGWVETTLGECFRWGSGGTPTSSNSRYYGGEIPWLVIGDLNDGVVTNSATNITEEGLSNSSTKLVEIDSVLVAMYGSIGKAAIAGRRLTTNQAIAFTYPEPIDTKYLFYYIKHSQNDLAKLGKGATQLNISQTVIKSFPFVLSPLNEQKRIVEKIEELFSKLDAGVAALKRVQANLKRYRAAVLKAAVEGKLTEEWRKQNPNTEPASILLQRILSDRRQKWESEQLEKYQKSGKTPPKDWQSKYKEPSAPDTTNLPPLPDGWCWVSCSALIYDISGGTTKVPKDTQTDFPILRSSSVRQGFIDLLDVRYLLEEDNNLITENDLLFVRLSGSVDYVGACGKVKAIGNRKIVFPDRLFRAKAVSEMISRYIELCFSASIVRKKITKKAKSSAGHQRISIDDITNQVLPVPPQHEQLQILEYCEQAFSILAQLDLLVTNDLLRSSRLRQAILKQAFSGKLVPQDPNDEPASELLQRIQAEREKTAQAKPAKRQPRRKVESGQ